MCRRGCGGRRKPKPPYLSHPGSTVDAHGLQPSHPASVGTHPALGAMLPRPRSHPPAARALGGTGSPEAAGTLLRRTSKRAPLCAFVFVPLPSVRLL